MLVGGRRFKYFVYRDNWATFVSANVALQMLLSLGWEMVGDCKLYTSEGCKFIGIIGE